MKTLENTSNYKRELSGLITCMLKHPTLGTIPNGLSQELDAELIAEIEAAGLIEEPTQAEKDAHEQTETLRLAEQTFNDTMSPILNSVSQLERDTWIVQEREAREWLADNDATVPFITTLADTRGVEMADLVGRIIAKADAYSMLLAQSLGEKHKVEDNVA